MKRKIVVVVLGLIMAFYSVGEARDDLLLWFSFHGTGNTAKDLSGNGNDGNIVGAKRVDGIYDKGISIGEKGEYVEMPNVIEPVGTIEFWFKPNWDGADLATYRLFDASAGAIFWLMGKGVLVNDRVNELGFFFEDAADSDFVIQTNSNVIESAGKWYHLAATWDFENKESKFYFNGEEVASGAGLGDFPELSPQPRLGDNLGPKDAEHGADSVIDEFAIYGRVLEPDEIKQDMEELSYHVESRYKLTTVWGKIKR